MIAIRGRAGSFIKTAYVICVIIAIACALTDSGVDLAKALDSLFVLESVVFFVAWIVMVFTLGLLWKGWLHRAEGISLRASEWIPVQAMAWAGRYLPGKVGLLMGKLALVQRHRVEMRALALSVVVEQAAFVIAGACVALLLFSPERLSAWAWAPNEVISAWTWWMPVALVSAAAMLPVIVAISARALGCHRVLAKSMQATVLIAFYAMPHVVIGAAFYLLAVGLFPHAAGSPVTHFVAVLAVAHVAGAVAVFAPAGFGVREVVLAAGLRGVLLLDEALLLAAVLRVLTLMADGSILLALGATWRRWRRSPA